MTENSTPTLAAARYRRAFQVTLVALVVVSAVAAWFWWTSPLNPIGARQRPPEAAASDVAGSSPAPPAETSEAIAGIDSTGSSPETPLTPIQLTPQRMQSIGVRIGTVELQPVSDEIRSYGNVQADERRFAYVQSRFAGWLRQVYANATGEFISKGQPLFTINSPDLVATQREYLLAKKNAAALAQSTVGGVAEGAASLVEAARARLEQWNMPPADVEKLDATGEVITDLTVTSPVSGYITEKNALPNMYVQPETKLYTIADFSSVWILAQVFQNDAGKIKPGNPAEVTLDAYPGQIFRGRVDYLLPQLDPATRTLPVRVVLPNPGLRLRPGMFVNVSLKLPLGQRLVVSDAAVFHSGTRTLVFAFAGEGTIEPREVELGPHIGDQFVILKGVKAGEQIVTSANFLIDSEAQLQAAAGAFMPPPPGAGQAAAMNVPQAQANVELTTSPSPPQKGSNTVRVKLTDQAGKPITGADVSVTFFMAAMPAMGMAAMRTNIQAADTGGGNYEGKGDLGSGGTWQVTITARQNSQTIATRQLSMTATGGM